jgi:hypothetical protein
MTGFLTVFEDEKHIVLFADYGSCARRLTRLSSLALRQRQDNRTKYPRSTGEVACDHGTGWDITVYPYNSIRFAQPRLDCQVD